MRSLFEYILVFSKSSDFVFNIDRVRTHRTLKKWWVKYPERYNPNGKAPEAIWKFDIPVQGSWGNGFIRHFCPLPEDMIGQILHISTNENDVVLDPFSGSGAVLAKAHFMRRRYIGLELNSRYIKMFEDYLSKTARSKRADYDKEKEKSVGRDEFYKTVINLRALKFAKILAGKIKSKGIARFSKIYVNKTSTKATKKNALVCIDYVLLVPNARAVVRLKNFLDKLCSVPPLSKYGIQYNFVYVSTERQFLKHIPGKRVYVYSEKATQKFEQHLDKRVAVSASNGHLIVSGIRVDVNEKDYD